MYSNLVLSKIGIRALLTTVLASLWECQPTAEQGSLSQMQCAISQFTSSSYLLFQSVKEVNQLSVGQARTCKAWKAQSAEPEHFWGGHWRHLDWTGLGEAAPHLQQKREPAEGCVLRGKTGNHWMG